LRFITTSVMKIIACALLIVGSAASAEWNQPARDAVLRGIDARAANMGDISLQIWELAEVGYKEERSSAMLKEELRGAGFTITDNVAGIPTAFSAQWGSGGPVIGILGEYDALPGLEQEVAPVKRPLQSTRPGHGCGHNLFGAASAFAAIAVKEQLTALKLPGTVRFYGCPAEEGGGGKIYMVRAGAFKDCDVVLHWHPGNENRASLKSNLGNITGKFRFHGTPAHAAGAPEKGRSALDAVMVFTHAVDLLREHVPDSTRLHYVITSGGDAPNVVPGFSEVFLYLRSPNMGTLDDVWPRVLKCAEAGALATETKFALEIVNSSYTILPNDSLAKLIDKNLREVGGVNYTPEETAFAEELRKSISGELPGLDRAAKILTPEEGTSFGSTDVGDVSWVAPTGGFYTATFVPGTPGHSWQSTACAGHSTGRKAMVNAAKVLALSAMDLFSDEKQIADAKASFEKRKGSKIYQSRLPADQKPPLRYRDVGK
jgi:aminobenzoyl-glutamate utilization protein B